MVLGIHSGRFKLACSSVKDATVDISRVESWPKAARRKTWDRSWKKLKQQLRLAEVTMAKEHGYPICKRHWPPGISLISRSLARRCRLSAVCWPFEPLQLGLSEDHPFRGSVEVATRVAGSCAR